jgi:hypothetical protein
MELHAKTLKFFLFMIFPSPITLSSSPMLFIMQCDTNDQLEGFDIHVCSCMQRAKKVMGTMSADYFLLQ